MFDRDTRKTLDAPRPVAASGSRDQPVGLLRLQRAAGNSAVAQDVVQRKPSAETQDRVDDIWRRFGGDDYVAETRGGLAMYRAWRSNPDRTTDATGLQWMKFLSEPDHKFFDAVQKEYGPKWTAAVGAFAAQRMGTTTLDDLSQAASITGTLRVSTDLLGIAPKRAEHSYLLKHAHVDAGLVAKAENWLIKKLETRIEVTYSNNLGPEFSFTKAYDVVGAELSAKLRVGIGHEEAVDQAKKSVWDKAKGAASGLWNRLTGGEKSAKSPEEEENPLLEGGLGLGVLNLDIDQGGRQAKAEEFWSARDLEGPILVATMLTYEGAFGPAVVGKVEGGISSFEFVGSGGHGTRLLFADVEPKKGSFGLGVGARVEVTPAALGAGYVRMRT